MKYVIALLITCTFTATVAASEVAKLKAGTLFSHTAHQTDNVGICSVCHENQPIPGKIAGFGKEWAHINCIDCHNLYEKGPEQCAGCHPNAKNSGKPTALLHGLMQPFTG